MQQVHLSQDNAVPPLPALNQSEGLSQRHIAMRQGGRTLVDDSNISEGNLKTIIEPLIEWTKAAVLPYGGEIQYFTKLSLADLQKKLADPEHIIGAEVSCACDLEATGGKCKGQSPDAAMNERVSIRPDAGIIMWTYKGIQYPLYIGEDKVQGTNDKLYAAGKPRQATGNAIERYFKNVRAEEMLCAHVPYFPSVVFASGCDFHSSETIAKRLEAGNYGTPNHYIEIQSFNTPDAVDTSMTLDTLVKNVSIRKQSRGAYAPFAAVSTVCIKAHKWDDLPHNSSLWRPNEYFEVSRRIVSLAIQEVLVHADNVHDD